MTGSSSTLDIEKFGKVHVLMTKGATEGERAAAKNRCEAIAKKAGLTLKQALSKLSKVENLKTTGFDAAAAAKAWADQHEREQQAAQKPKNIFEEIFNSPEFQAERAKRERRDDIKRAAVLKEYGSIVSLFNPTEREIALRKAVEDFAVVMPFACVSGVQRYYTAFLDGKMASDCFEGTDRTKRAVASAYAMPVTIGEAMCEAKAWDKLRQDRSLFIKYGYNEDAEVAVRQDLIRDFLKKHPATSWQDVEERFAWKRYEFESEYLEPVERDDPFMDRLEADFANLRKIYERATAQNGQEPEASATKSDAQNGRRTNADKANDVKSLLQTNPEFSDREISRRVGVSPQTVSNWRARIAQAELFPNKQGSSK